MQLLWDHYQSLIHASLTDLGTGVTTYVRMQLEWATTQEDFFSCP